ncbi:MAG TPA: bifunctional adenosylcobinamide kinase/adenosylcobinamide-phosphate guanylyltransferase [Acidimicrobiia bacterium]|nr:bifunctional adenosylcobinamide kinase/adenosylcobinamide-phosphate guanylyltransferase [Acidimicrobiia bacterium]
MIVLVLGAARSGKSRVAEQLAAATRRPVTYLATASPERTDAEFSARVERHRARRPHEWTTRECGAALPAAITGCRDTVLADSLGTWIAAHRDLDADTDALCDALLAHPGTAVVVSEEVGWSVHPVRASTRRFVDRLGECNQAVAHIADRVVLVVAGRPLELPACDA